MKKLFLLMLIVLNTSFWVHAQEEDPPEADQEEDTPVSHEEISGDKNLVGSRPWRAPDYSHQEEALGWSETAFDIPKGMEDKVHFWIDIYSKYNTDQGVLHDSENINLIYSVLDFTSISRQADLPLGKREAMKRKMVKTEKRRVIEILKKLDKVRDPTTLNAEEQKIWNAFSNINEKNKFIVATKKGRLRFQLGQKDRIVQGIYFSGRYLEDFEKIFRELGIPMELTRLVFVESSFNVLARSKVGASGLWQLMRYTAKPYMMMNEAIDKRNHPIEAARVGAKLLKIGFNLLESWPLAVTGWNHGPSGILRLTKKYRTRQLSELVDNVTMKKRFGFASRNFYASFLAILEVEKNAAKYLGPVSWSQPLEGVEVRARRAMRYSELLNFFGDDDMKLQIYNPHINKPARTGRVLIPKGAVLSLPKQKVDEFLLWDKTRKK